MNLAYQHFRRFVLIGICIALTWAFHAYAFCEEDSLSQDYGVSLKGLEDEATFYLYSKGTQLATIEYTRKPTGDVTARFTLSLADQTSRTETVITTDADGRWREIITTMPQGKIKAHRENLLVEQDVLSRRSTVTLQPDTLLYDNNIPGLFSDWVRRHREDGKKIKKISVYSAGAPLFHAAIETRESVNRLIEGQCRSLDRFTVYLPGLDTQLWTDDQGRVVMFDIPTQKSSFVRGGFESLLNKGEEDPSLSLPQHTVSVQKDIMIPMRDKVKLATDLYLPEGVSEFPVVLMRTPYGKAIMEIEGRFWAQRGYTCAIQDCRGRFKSQGVWVPFMHEAKDGYDTIEHLAAIPGCNGNVGMIGASYGGWVQWWAASLKPPHLKTMIPCVSPTDPQYNLPYEYGAFFLTGALWWAAVVEAEATADLSGKTMAEINKADYKKILNRLPVIDMDKALLGAENSYWRAWIKNAEDADYWRPACFMYGL
ncbi:MAG: CocE/NonD family hydrolase [Planctomycetota bacterium]